jgi:hypothetical protein
MTIIWNKKLNNHDKETIENDQAVLRMWMR